MMVFNYLTDFILDDESSTSEWLSSCISRESFKEDEVNIIFSNDEELLDKNIKYLKHNTLTDIIGFDYSIGKLISGDIFISIDRIRENALKYKVNVDDELHRVIIHGILHFCGYKDKTKEDKLLMREKEDYYLSLRTF